jgi:hypothetical protein
MNDIMEYTKNENLKFLVIKACHGNYYGFNLKVKLERAYAMKIVSPVCHPILCPNTIRNIPY